MNAETAGARRRIIEAAQSLVQRDGFGNVGIAAICSEAGAAKGSFYHFFPTKQALLEVLVEENRQAVLHELDDIGRSFGNGRDKIIAHFQTLLDAAREQHARSGRISGCPLGTIASDASGKTESPATALNDWQQRLEGLVRQGIDDGSLAPSVSPGDTAFGLLAVIQGMSTLGRSLNDSDLLERIAQTAVKRLLPARANS